MGQQEVIDTLKKKGKLSAGEIAEILEANARGVRECLKSLLKYHEVKRIKLTREEVMELGKVQYSGEHFVWVLVN